MDAAVETPSVSLAKQGGNFALHFLEMCVSMCVGGVVLFLAFFVVGPATIGYADPRPQFPELSLLVIAFMFTVPMALWMRFRGLEWRPIMEMSGAAVAVAILLIGLGWVGILTASGLREFAGPAFCGPACGAMFLAMLFRLDMYAGRTGHMTPGAKSA
jgi:hypothetical protein